MALFHSADTGEIVYEFQRAEITFSVSRLIALHKPIDRLSHGSFPALIGRHPCSVFQSSHSAASI
jgi:hypothetical protein